MTARTRTSRLALPVLLAVLVPLGYAAVYLGAGHDPTASVDDIPAAVVNLDRAVTVTGSDGTEQIVPLGRQLVQTLVTDDRDDTFAWTLVDAGTAQAGLDDGHYAAVLTIPEDFSATATTISGSAAEPQQATITLTTDDAYAYLSETFTRSVGTAAAAAINAEVTGTYLDTVYLGFADLRDQLGTAADGSQRLAAGADELADGATEAADGAARLGAGVGDLASGAVRLRGGTFEVAGGASGLATGADGLSAGLEQLRAGTAGLPADTARLDAGARQVADGAGRLAQATRSSSTAATDLAVVADGLRGGLVAQRDYLRGLADGCAASGASADYCRLVAATVPGADGLVGTAEGVAAGVRSMAGTSAGIATAAGQLDAGASQLAAGTGRLAGAAPALRSGVVGAADGAAALAGGARRLADGARQVDSGTDELASGVVAAAGGAAELASGTQALAGGARELGDGAGDLATGLDDGAAQVPVYDDDQRAQQATVAAEPVVSEVRPEGGGNGGPPGPTPWFAALALWFGAVAITLVRRPLSSVGVASTASAARVALLGALPGALLALVQAALLAAALIVAGVAAPLLVVPFAALAAITFTLLVQALVAGLGGTGRWIAVALVSVQVATAGGTFPPGAAAGAVGMLERLLPLTPAVAGLRALAAGTPGAAAATAGLLVWLLLACGLSVLAVHRARSWDPGRASALAVPTRGLPVGAGSR